MKENENSKKELNEKEMDKVSGGFGPLGFLLTTQLINRQINNYRRDSQCQLCDLCSKKVPNPLKISGNRSVCLDCYERFKKIEKETKVIENTENQDLKNESSSMSNDKLV